MSLRRGALFSPGNSFGVRCAIRLRSRPGGANVVFGFKEVAHCFAWWPSHSVTRRAPRRRGISGGALACAARPRYVRRVERSERQGDAMSDEIHSHDSEDDRRRRERARILARFINNRGRRWARLAVAA